MASESPYDALGQPVEQDAEQKREALFGGRYENAFTVAHRAVGEWRSWRDILDENEVADAFDLRAITDDGVGRLLILSGTVDLTADLGLSCTIKGRSPGLQGDVVLEVNDPATGEFDVALKASTDDVAGETVRLSEDDFYDPEGEPVPLRLVLESEAGRHWLDLEFDTDTWLAIWLHREITVRITAEPTRFEVRVPAPTRAA